MADSQGNRSPKKRPLRYFFFKDKLHKKLRINRSADTIEAWCYPDSRRVVYTYSVLKRGLETAYSTVQVAEMLGKHTDTIENAVKAGNVPEPQIVYTMSANKRKHAWKWDERAIMDLHAYFLTVHRGRPRKDGRITPQQMPTARELRAMVRQEEILYKKMPDGSFQPTWRAEDFT